MRKYIFGLLLLSSPVLGATTPRAGINLIPDGTLNWGAAVRSNYQIEDSSFAVQAATNSFTSTNTFTQDIVISYGSASQCLALDTNKNVITQQCTGNGTASTLAVLNGNGVQVSSPTAAINFSTNTFTASLVGSATAQVDLNKSTTYFIQNTPNAQGATFNVSSGTATSFNAATATVTSLMNVTGTGQSGSQVAFQVAGSTFSVAVNGNVGLGTAAPQSTLDVRGLVTASTITVTSGTVSTFYCGTCTVRDEIIFGDGTTMTSTSTFAPSSIITGIVSPGTFTWTNNFGIGGSTLVFSTVTFTSATISGVTATSMTLTNPSLSSQVLGTTAAGLITNNLTALTPDFAGIKVRGSGIASPGAFGITLNPGNGIITAQGEIDVTGSLVPNADGVYNLGSGVEHWQSLQLFGGINESSNTSTNIFASSSTFNGTVAISSGLIANGSAGTNGQVLTSGGANTTPSWTTVSGSGGSGIVSPGTFTWTNNFGISLSTAAIGGTFPLLSTSTLQSGATIYVASGTVTTFAASTVTLVSSGTVTNLDVTNLKFQGDGIQVQTQAFFRAGAQVGVSFSSATSSSDTTSGSFVDTGLSNTITPKSTADIVEAIFSGEGSNNTSGDLIQIQISCAGSGICPTNGCGQVPYSNGFNQTFAVDVFAAPASTSPYTCKLQFRQVNGGTSHIEGSSGYFLILKDHGQ